MHHRRASSLGASVAGNGSDLPPRQDSSEMLTIQIDGEPQRQAQPGKGTTPTASLAPSVGWRPVEQLAAAPNSRERALSIDMSGSTNAAPSNARPPSVYELNNTPAQAPIRVPGSPHTFQCPQAPEVLKLVDAPYRAVGEFNSLFYTPVTCEPEDFALPENQYTLRPVVMGRRTELLIAITMYNESDEFLIRTLSAVFKNIRYLCQFNSHHPNQHNPRNSSLGSLGSGGAPTQQQPLPPANVATVGGVTFVKPSSDTGPAHLQQNLRGEQIWKYDGWQKIVVVIIADGRLKCHKRVLQMLQAMGVYQEDVRMQETVDPVEEKPVRSLPVTAHLYETTCQAIVEPDLQLRGGSRHSVVPVQMLFCLKEKNAKKLNSHKWLFRGIAPLLNPNVCVLIDVGTRPKTHDSIYHLWKAFDRSLNIAGACGEICVMIGKGCSKTKNVLHPLVAAQNFEYKISNILDKPLESTFGYISVLPGAFSAYRWEALQDINADEGPLVAYFKGEVPNVVNVKGNVFSSNMYLAEDRILCFELVAKRDARWKLHYVKDAKAETDVPSTVAEFISQRRRWLNGTFFCQIYAIAHMGRFWNTQHGFMRKMMLMLQYVYFAITLIFNWFGLANFYLSFYLLSLQALTNVQGMSSELGGLLFDVLRLVYTTIIIAQFICALGNRPQGAKSIYIGSMILFSGIMLFLIVMSLLLIYRTWPSNGESWFLYGGTGRDVVLATLSTYGVFVFSALLSGEMGHIVSCIFQYLLMLPFFINTLTIYAFCNSHDVSWGTKGDNKAEAGSGGSGAGMKKQEESEKRSNFAAISEVQQPPTLAWSQLSQSYQSALQQLQTRPKAEKQSRDDTTKREDYYRNVRTWLVLVWVMSNGLLVAVISSDRIAGYLVGGVLNPYMSFLMYSVAVFSFVRLFGCILYLIKRRARKY